MKLLRNAGECAAMDYEIELPMQAGFKADLTLKMEIAMEFDSFPFLSGISWQVEWKSEALKLCPRLY